MKTEKIIETIYDCDTLIQSYVKRQYFVSTAFRRASTAEAHYFYETIVWEWDENKKTRGEMLEQSSDGGPYPRRALANHAAICAKLAVPHNPERKDY